MNEVKIGDIVILRSGGPTMTVIETGPDKFINTVWFVNDELKRDAFDQRELVKVESI